MPAHAIHPYALQDAAFFFALIPIVALLTIMLGAKCFDAMRRARKPLPSRPPGISFVSRGLTALPE